MRVFLQTFKKSEGICPITFLTAQLDIVAKPRFYTRKLRLIVITYSRSLRSHGEREVFIFRAKPEK
ncbi:MAG: hypothetical protein U5L45_06590 [Saprospiraceae bacterium]|nr:hypothetical protein [Saprospiraceae bacterium]